MRRGVFILLAIAANLIVLSVALAAAPEQGLSQPPGPIFYRGEIFVMDEPGEADLTLVACIDGCESEAGWQSAPAIIPEPGRYVSLSVGPPEHSFVGKQITFHLITEFGITQADETAIYNPARTPDDITQTLNLHFGEAPPKEATPTPKPTPTITPIPTSTPVLPIPGDSSVPRLSRIALIVGIIAVVVGALVLFAARRRRAF